MAIRTCINCGQTKPLRDMGLRSGKPRNQCKECLNELSKSYLKSNPEKAARNAENARAWRQRNPDRTAEYTRRKNERPGFKEQKRAYMREYYANMSESERRDRDYRRFYGISLAEYEEMLHNQGGVCAICGQPPDKDSRQVTGLLVVDHCHTNGHVRGLLCSTCNLAIGYFKDNADHLLSAAQYLLKDANLLKTLLKTL
jgi:hypothetical protein